MKTQNANLLETHSFQVAIICLTKNLKLEFTNSPTDELKKVDWRYFLAGGICAACSHGITTPIDVVKTKMQTSPEKYTQGVIQAAKDIIKTEGLGFLLSGLGNNVFCSKTY